MLKLPKPPPKTNPPDSLEFKGFGLSFSASGPHAIYGGLFLVTLAFVLMALFPNAISQAVGLAKLLS